MGLPQPTYTIDEYLAFERQSEERREYLDGHIDARADESLEHGIIYFNLAATLGMQLRGKKLLGFISLTRKSAAARMTRRRPRTPKLTFDKIFHGPGDPNQPIFAA